MAWLGLNHITGPSEGKMKCYGLVDSRRPWPLKEVIRRGGPGSSPGIFLLAKPSLLGTFHSLPNSAKTSFPASLQMISALTKISSFQRTNRCIFAVIEEVKWARIARLCTIGVRLTQTPSISPVRARMHARGCFPVVSTSGAQ